MSSNRRHVVFFSGGLGSWFAAKRVAEQNGTDNLTLLFTDVKGNNSSPHAGEDADTYRFLEEAAADVGGELVILNEGRDIWQVFKDANFLGNNRNAVCSRELKQKPAKDWVAANRDPADTVLYVGIDGTEAHRMPAVRKGYDPFRVEAPLIDEMWPKEELITQAEDAGLTVPRLYRAGFPHNNCGGGCVRAGHAQFALLLREHEDRYRYWEEREEEVRQHIGADVAILRDRTGGHVTPLTLREFRERIESQTALFDPNDFGGCGCFVDDEEGRP